MHPRRVSDQGHGARVEEKQLCPAEATGAGCSSGPHPARRLFLGLTFERDPEYQQESCQRKFTAFCFELKVERGVKVQSLHKNNSAQKNASSPFPEHSRGQPRQHTALGGTVPGRAGVRAEPRICRARFLNSQKPRGALLFPPHAPPHPLRERRREEVKPTLRQYVLLL